MSENNKDEVLDELLDEIGDTDDSSISEAAELLKKAAEENDNADSDEDNDTETPEEFDIYADENEEPEIPAEPAVRRQPQRRNSSSKKKKHKKKKRKRSRLPGILILTTFIIAASVSLSLVIIAFGKDILGIGKSDVTKLLVIQEGTSTDEIAGLLEEEGIIRSPECFKLFSRLRKTDDIYIAGEHFVSPNMAYEAIIDELTTIHEEEKETVKVTFPEGETIYDAANLLQEEGVCSASEFIFYFNSGGFGFEFENKLPSDTTLKLNRMEGYVFPDTYYFYTDMEPEQVCQKIYLNFQNKLTDERLKKMESLGLNLDQLITFSSIVQKEAATKDTMATVASVFWNRLRNSDTFPLLQSDPTSNYANYVVRPHMEVYDKNIIDAYDTYVSPGLPPGPICNPGIEAIDAVLSDIKTNYFYFMANTITGRTEFSETLEEHEVYQAEIESEVDEYIASSEAASREEAALAAAEEEAAANAEQQ